MKLQSYSLKFVLAYLSLITAQSAQALTGDTDKPVNINSGSQSLDMKGNIATFSRNVIITQGSIRITADKVVVRRPGGDSSKTVVDATGNPVTFYQLQDNGKPIRGHAAKIHYEMAKDYIELTGNAWLEQLNSNVRGDRITYLVKAQKMQAFGSPDKRVTTVLMPTQLQNKNTAPNSQSMSK